MIVRSSSRILPALLAAGAVFLAPEHSWADVKAGVDAWSAGDYKTAIKQWQGPADRGDADAQFNLAQAYKLGRGVEQDLAKAERYYQLAAASGHLQAADNYGLLLFQRGERARAMPFIGSASDRGDPRAQYILGLAHFNGDNAAKDWVRAYALMSLAQQSGLPQAKSALQQMDQHIPMEQRQESVPLAAELRLRANSMRASHVAARDLGAPLPAPSTGPEPGSGPASAGADFVRPKAPVAAATPTPNGWIEVPPPSPVKPGPPSGPAVAQATRVPAPAAKPSPPAKSVAAPKPAATRGGQGQWRAQLGAFGVAGNAERLWSRLSARAELAGKRKMLVPTGALTKLQAGGFASQAAAAEACGKLKAAGFACLVVKD